MREMFRDACAFNGDIGAWDVSKVTDMREMFGDASAFNQDISAWDVSEETDTWGMFERATSFNQYFGGRGTKGHPLCGCLSCS